MARKLPLHSLSSREEIERLVHGFFEPEGCPPSPVLEHWLRADAEFRQALLNCQWEAAIRQQAVVETPPPG